MGQEIPSDYDKLYYLYMAQLKENERLRGLLRIHGIDDQPEQKAQSALADTSSYTQAKEMTGKQLSLDLSLAVDSPPPNLIGTGFQLTKKSILSEKTALFRKLFTGREDVYAYRWINKAGRSGYSPACRNLWVHGVCGKPKAKCTDCPNADYYPFDDDAIRKHLSGEQVFGVYPLLSDDTCRFLAIDFDESTWKDDVICLRTLCEEEGIPCSVEISRSGNGAHVWFFLSEPVEAALARRFATGLLETCMQKHPRMTFKSFDRMFPNQDTMPKGGFGNLIALPLQKEAAQSHGGSLFVDDEFLPYRDQWAYLSSVQFLTRDGLQYHSGKIQAAEGIPQKQGDEEKPWNRPTDKLPPDDKTEQLSCVWANSLYIETKGVSSRAQNQLKRLASFSNPEFYRRQAMRQHIPLGMPRLICCVEYDDDYLCLPRGCVERVQAWAEYNSIPFNLDDKRNLGRRIDVAFNGTLREEQVPAFDALNSQDCGILSATTAFGKTVIGAALIAEKKANTLIIVQRKQLMEQWQERLTAFLTIHEVLPEANEKKRGRRKKRDVIGVYGGGKDTRGGIIDIAIQQSLGKMEDVKDWIADYGMVIVDECHHVPAPTFEQVLQKVSAKYFYGLSATPNRKDGHHPILKMYLGDIRYRVDAKSEAKKRPFSHVMIPRFAGTAFVQNEKSSITRFYTQLAEDELRNHLIADDVIGCVKAGRNCLVLSERKQHVLSLADLISHQGFTVHTLLGGTSKKETARALDALRDAPEPLIICATGKYVGEGFDESRLDTLFLTMPISWKGTLVQYAGRLHRLHEGKREVRIYDYIDSSSEMLERMYQKRLNGYASLGYTVGSGESEAHDLIYDADQFRHPLLSDIEHARQSIVISSPYVSARGIRALMPALLEAVKLRIRVEIRTKELTVYKKSAASVDRALNELIGVQILLSNDTFLKYVIIDERVVWYGGMDMLGTIPPDSSVLRLTSGSIAARFVKTDHG